MLVALPGPCVRARCIALAGIATIAGATALGAQGDSAAAAATDVGVAAGPNRIVIVRPGAPLPLRAQIDGPVWASADSITTFRQLDPVEGAPATERTVVKVLRDHDALVIAVRAYDRDPAGIRASQLRRDADLSSDDNITLLIDSFHDHRSGFVFQTNPNGAQWDGQVSGNQDNVNASWNGIWYVATARDAQGWAAVFRIPFRTLRFEAGGGAAVGFNVQRFIRRKNETDLWRGWRRTEGLYQFLSEGDLSGLGGISRARDIEFRPYVLGELRQSAHDSVGNRLVGAGGNGKVGLDAKLAVSPTLTADLTVNTDFAQVEVDSQVINLTRFPTFFPEKREFFLESSGIFDFGSVGREQLFYSRRIGLSDSGTVVPILGGGRVYGKLGPWTVGVIDARTGSVEQANDAVIRVKRDVFDRAYVGALATAQTGPGRQGGDFAGGIDGDFPLLIGHQNIEPTFWLAGTHTPGFAGTRSGGRVEVDFPNDLFDNNVQLTRIDSGFTPTLGFVNRTGVWYGQGHIDFMPRPHRFGIRQLLFELPSWGIYTDERGFVTEPRTWQTATINWLPLGWIFESGDQFSFTVHRQMDAPPSPFEIFRGVNVLAGRYWWTRADVQYQTSLARPVSALALVAAGRFYDGHATETDLATTWRTGGHVIVGAGVSRTEAQLSGGHFVAVQTTGRLEYAFTTQADLLAFAQYDNSLNRADFDFRFHWSPIIGDDVFLVWNSGYTTDPLARFRFPDGHTVSHPLDGALILKVVHRVAP
jgi:uncharacterized protein DUF5916/cellulose/xylan binding protein with CBM9 domain